MDAAQPDSGWAIPATALALGGGYALWLLLYFTMPRPVRTYVLAHELTHALWGVVMGARVSKMRIAKDHGSVSLSKTNFLITLAPYFFPLYTVLVIIGYYILSIWFRLDPYYLVWLGLVGFTWGFHFTFTVSTLFQRQSDIRQCGRLFSYTVIYMLNVLGICLWVVIVSHVSLADFVDILSARTTAAYGGCVEMLLRTGQRFLQ